MKWRKVKLGVKTDSCINIVNVKETIFVLKGLKDKKRLFALAVT